MTTILEIARQNISFETQVYHAVTGPIPHSPMCKMCSRDIDKPFMRLYNWHYEETVYTCTKRCYHAFMIFYEAIGETKRKVKEREVNFIAKFERLESLDMEDKSTLLTISRAMRTIGKKVDG
jgi:hypothetical protein